MPDFVIAILFMWSEIPSPYIKAKRLNMTSWTSVVLFCSCFFACISNFLEPYSASLVLEKGERKGKRKHQIFKYISKLLVEQEDVHCVSSLL